MAELRADLATDVVIVGAGMVGLTLAVALGGCGVVVALIDRDDPARQQDAGFDGRTSAIAYGSRRILEGIGAWRGMAPDAEPIREIRVADGDSPLFLHYGRDEAGADLAGEPLGHIVENRLIRRALASAAGRLPSVALHAPARIGRVERGDGGVAVTLDDGRRIRAALVVAADGRNSALRREAGILAAEWRYRQTAIVCTAVHAATHGNVAHERFLPAGPFAVLPMRDDADGAHRSSIVWTERDTLAPAILALDEAAFTAELVRRFGTFLGPVAVRGPRFSHPLGVLHALRYVDRRLALVGDAAHAIHPIAGQGLNMGLRDVAALAEILVDARRVGLDLGDPLLLARYERWRRADNTALMLVTDGLNRLFSTDLAPLRLARDLGLAAVNRLPPLKAFFMRHAMGVVGELPRLTRGEPL